jgi:hypothetical protein
MEIASVAGKRQVLERILAAMLAGDNVLNMESRHGLEILVQSAIFASLPRAFLHQPA